MKHLYLISVLFFLLTGVITAQVPNGGFESWTGGDPDNWATSNAFPINLITVTQSSDVHSGDSAAKGEVVAFYGTPMGPVLQSGDNATGFPISQQYHSVELYYKFSPVGGDLFGVNVALEKNGSPIAQGAVALPAQVNSYTYLSVPLTYTTTDIPDNAIIQIMISGPNGSDYHVGSVMYVDDVSLSMVSGITDPFSQNIVSCYPNPADDLINFNTGSDVIIYDHLGKEVKSVKGTGCTRADISDLPEGIYFYRSGNYSGKFIKKLD